MKKQFNINLYHIKFFEETIKQHLFASLICLFLPPQFVWMENHKFTFELKLLNLRKATLQDGSHNLAKAKRLFNQGEQKIAKKNLVHGLRYLNFGQQLVKTGKIIDLTGNVNETWKEVRKEKNRSSSQPHTQNTIRYWIVK